MAARLYAEFTSSFFIDYVIEFHDNEFTGAAQKIQVSGDGFELNYSGQTDNIYSPIIGSSVNVGIINQGEPHLLQYISLLKQYQQDRFSVVIYREADARFIDDISNVSALFEARVAADGGTVESPACYKQDITDLGGTFRYIGPIDEELYWAGIISQDLIEIEDVANPAAFSIQATDGIAKLKDTTVTTSYFRQFTNQFINALDASGVLGIYGADDPVLAVSCNWWAAEMTYNANNNPLDETWADFRAFDTIDEDGVLTGRNWYDVLSQMCYLFGLRFYYANGKYRLEQLFIRDNATFTEHRYKKNKDKIDEAVVSYEKTIDQISGQARLAGNIFNFLPAVKNVTVVLNKEPKAIIGVRSTDTIQPVTQLGFVASTPDNQITVSFRHAASIDVNTQVSQTNKFMKLRLNMEIYDFNNNVTYYLKRTYTGMTASTSSWTTTQAGSGYEVLLGPMDEYTVGLNYVTGNTTIVTPKTPADGDVEYDWEFVEFVNTAGATYTLNAANSYGWVMETTNLITTNGQGITNQTNRIRAVSPNTKIKSNISYELPEMNLLTGNGERGSLMVQTTVGSIDIHTPYSNWREGNSGSYKQIQKLVTQEFLKLMDAPIEKYMGGMYSIHDFNERLEFDGKEWIQLGGTFSANMDQWDGEWFAIAKADITPTFEDVTTASDVVSFDNVNAVTGNTSFNGLDAVNLDTNVLDVTTTANVGTDLDVGGDGDFSGRMDIGGALDVVGNSTLSATSVGSFTTTKQVNVTINDITGNPGGSETLTLDDHFNFVSYSGGNGTYTITLPNADSGVIMRFKTDDSVVANKTITLSPQSGQRIDGESSYLMDRSYDGISVLGHNDNWFVIQKKEK
jgi:hypothetical protein